ncbi:uncharacterized DUF497 family protein [Moryella indoligenes]|uniref:Uncharacterized DUF497 family protein n=1 Tax=Moryella indoligenes TaxID=371674 RepID=A0AAE3V9A4_9FIRM|nr:uncharacterized DUF497 family protein [Moryella indoligenes]
MTFEWDENKNQINKQKHGIAFEEAQTVFYDGKHYWNTTNCIRRMKIDFVFLVGAMKVKFFL